MVHFASFLSVKHVFLLLLASFFLYLIWLSMTTTSIEGLDNLTNVNSQTTALDSNSTTASNQSDMVTNQNISNATYNTSDTDDNYDMGEISNDELKSKVQEQAAKIIAGMEINNEITSELNKQRLRNKKLIAKLKAKDVELAAFEKHIEQLQEASYQNKINTELSGSVVFPKQVVNQ